MKRVPTATVVAITVHAMRERPDPALAPPRWIRTADQSSFIARTSRAVWAVSAASIDPDLRRRAEAWIIGHLERRTLEPVIDREFTRNEIVAAHPYMDAKLANGTRVLTVR